MANSRYDNIRYYDGSSAFKIPSQIKVFDGSTWIDYGKKDSFNKKKIAAHNGSSFFCATYYRNDVDIPKTVSIGSKKYLNLKKSNGDNLSVDTYNGDYIWEMIVEVNKTTPLYTAFTRNQGDIINQSYTNYIAEVSGSAVRLKVNTHFSGNRISDGKYVTGTLNKYTPYCFTVGEKVRIYLTRSTKDSKLRVRIYNTAGTKLCDEEVGVNTQWVGTPNKHRLGSATTDNNGSQSTYGSANIHYFKTTPVDDRSKTFIIDIASQSNDTKTIYSKGSFEGYASASGTKVYGASYTEYIRQTI